MRQTWGMTMDPVAGSIPEFGLPDRLRKAREHAGFGSGEFADMLGVSRNTVGNYESGRIAPKKAMLSAWSLATGVPVSWLQTGESPRPAGPDGGSVVRHQGLEPRTR
ncbi:helix-turn-helix transcriptional regulator [Cellulomonas sp. NPDC089187]|uniref:helix-turn-helix domain-containing protein n=1 Tax=Cellulomonas sp. NPDC089187 TaxID=3154970 RepID=UPI0034399689